MNTNPTTWQWVAPYSATSYYVAMNPYVVPRPPSVWDRLRAATRTLEAALLERAAA